MRFEKTQNLFTLNRAAAHHLFLRSVVFLLLLGQLWGQAGVYAYTTIENKTCLIELHKDLDTESEKESEKEKGDKEQGEDKLIFFLLLPPEAHQLPFANLRQENQHPLLQHLETATPPPESFRS